VIAEFEAGGLFTQTQMFHPKGPRTNTTTAVASALNQVMMYGQAHPRGRIVMGPMIAKK